MNPSVFRVLAGSFMLQAKDRVTSNFFIGTLFIQPIIFTVLSVGTYRYGGKPNFALYAIIGAGMIGIWNSNLWTSGRIVDDERRAGTLALIVASPTAMPLVLLGKSLSNAVASLIAMAITFGTGLVAFRMPIGIENPLSFLVGLVLTLIAMTCLGLILGTVSVITRNSGDFLSVMNYPIFLLSGLTFPLTVLPLWTRPLSAALAPTWGNLALNEAAGVIAGSVWPNYLWLIGLSAVYLFVARFLFRRVEYLMRQAGSLEEW